MGRLIPPHIGLWRQVVLPTQAQLEPFVEREHDHWFWGGDFHDFDGTRLAVLPWGQTKIVVVRALWVYANNIDTHETVYLRRACAYSACVCPAHVVRVGEGFNNKTYVMTKPLPLRDGTLLVRHEAGGRIHLKPEDVTHTLCGRRVRPRRPCVSATPVQGLIDCQDCIRTLLAQGYVLETR